MHHQNTDEWCNICVLLSFLSQKHGAAIYTVT